MRRLVLLFTALMFSVPAAARDQGQWTMQAPDIAEYFKSLKQPDFLGSSCCGEADAYYADKTALGPNGELIAIITDTRDDEPLKRRHVEVGTKITIPPSKLRPVAIPNPTDHVLVFLSMNDLDIHVWCYEPLALN